VGTCLWHVNNATLVKHTLAKSASSPATDFCPGGELQRAKLLITKEKAVITYSLFLTIDLSQALQRPVCIGKIK
ncbi:MAG: hypothetical protein K2L96_09380, partial [Muribaculaceae bacterium]|nr:hypothetical protein [Muribaculaceae bacterium]